MSLQDTLAKAVATLDKYPELFAPAKLHRNISTYDISTGVAGVSTRLFDVRGVIDSYDFKEIDGVNVMQNDMKFHVLNDANLMVDFVSDTVELGGKEYRIVNVRSTHIGDKGILYTLQLRA